MLVVKSPAYFFGDDGFDPAFLLGEGRGCCFFGVPLATMGRAFSELSESSSLELERTSPSICPDLIAFTAI